MLEQRRSKKEQIIELYEQDYSYDEIVKKLHINYNFVVNVINMYEKNSTKNKIIELFKQNVDIEEIKRRLDLEYVEIMRYLIKD